MDKSRVGSGIFLVAGLYGFIFSVTLPMGRWNEPGAGVVPLSLSILLTLSGLVGLFFKRGEKKEKAPYDWRGMGKRLVAPIQIVMLTAAFILALEKLGFLLTSSIYLFLLFIWVSRYRFWAAIGLALLLGIGTWYFFERILSVQLPRGLFI